MNRFNNKVSLRDVATLAGVSVGTASQALNDHTRVNPQTRAKVQQAAAKLGLAAFQAAASPRGADTREFAAAGTRS